MKKAFTLVEILIVVSILGILAAVVLPSLQAHTTQARNAVAKESLATMRRQIELYKFQHNDTPPGFKNGSPIPSAMIVLQFKYCSSVEGNISAFIEPSGVFDCGPYLLKMAKNPFNNLDTIKLVPDATAFSTVADGLTSGWLYKAGTGDIRLNSTGADEDGVKHYDL
ncbi:MAG: type II secretion system GspH family protein [Phycisphaerae bacterium]|nr:type II secretion system GspH family protein [Phycisphaerae bacterium]